MKQTYWLSSERMTISVEVEVSYENGFDEEMVVWTPPIARKFIGQPLGNLIGWMTKQGGFRMERGEHGSAEVG